jgi:mxaC protein
MSFFKSLDLPYRAFEAESLESFAKAMDEIDQQHYQTLVVEETLPREDKSQPFFIIALLSLLLLAMAQLYTVWGVKTAHE